MKKSWKSKIKYSILLSVPLFCGFPCSNCDEPTRVWADLTLESSLFGDSSTTLLLKGIESAADTVSFELHRDGSPQIKYYSTNGSETTKDSSAYFTKGMFVWNPIYGKNLAVYILNGKDTLGILDTVKFKYQDQYFITLKSINENSLLKKRILEIHQNGSVDTIYWESTLGFSGC